MCHPVDATSIACDANYMGASFSSAAETQQQHMQQHPQQHLQQHDVEDSERMCFICLDSAGDLSKPCACPRYVHETCLASEERYCRFCNLELKDWKIALTPGNMQPVQPVMVVTLGDAVHRIAVKPGPDGMREFQQRIRTLFAIPDGTEFEVTFRCKAPYEAGRIPADTIQLEGMSSYDAATHCASLMAAQRLATGGSPAFVR